MLGAHPGTLVSHSTAEILVIRDGLGHLRGHLGASSRVQLVEPITATTRRRLDASAAGTSDPPAIVGYRLGRGIVVEVGLVGFGSSLARSVDSQELTRRLWTSPVALRNPT